MRTHIKKRKLGRLGGTYWEEKAEELCEFVSLVYTEFQVGQGNTMRAFQKEREWGEREVSAGEERGKGEGGEEKRGDGG